MRWTTLKMSLVYRDIGVHLANLCKILRIVNFSVQGAQRKHQYSYILEAFFKIYPPQFWHFYVWI